MTKECGRVPGHGKSKRTSERPYTGSLRMNGRPVATLMGKMLSSLAIPFVACFFGGAAAPLAQADAQGWNGSGWYVTNTTSAAVHADEVSAYILFNGPYSLQSGCLEVYDRLYSPIGTCRFFDVKPAAFAN
jgi:hypothetical protein